MGRKVLSKHLNSLETKTLQTTTPTTFQAVPKTTDVPFSLIYISLDADNFEIRDYDFMKLPNTGGPVTNPLT
jgi:hypothetical protein